MNRFLILSNGHGEDLSGSLLACKLIANGNHVDALPLVGSGNEYKKNGIRIISKTRNFNTGGLGYNSLKGRINDLFNGQIIYFLQKMFIIFFVRKNYDYLIAVGDIVPIFISWLSGKKYFIYLVAYSSHYEGKLRLPWPCKYFLRSSNVLRIYSRDLLTSYDLTNQLKREVIFLGNPFMDNLSSDKKKYDDSFDIALLPGSRSNELRNNFHLMLDLLERISSNKYFEKINFSFALIFNFKIDSVQELLEKRDWRFVNKSSHPDELIYRFKFIKVKFKWHSFEKILNRCDFAISMAGTAAEQVIGIAKPVIQIEGLGPQFTKSFAEAQRRLLGEYVFCYSNYINKEDQLNGTINLILNIIYLIKLDTYFLKGCQKIASNRIGKKGATLRMISDIEKSINYA